MAITIKLTKFECDQIEKGLRFYIADLQHERKLAEEKKLNTAIYDKEIAEIKELKKRFM